MHGVAWLGGYQDTRIQNLIVSWYLGTYATIYTDDGVYCPHRFGKEPILLLGLGIYPVAVRTPVGSQYRLSIATYLIVRSTGLC